MAVSYKVNYKLTKWHNKSAPREMKIYVQERIVHNGDNSFVHNCSKVEIAQMSI